MKLTTYQNDHLMQPLLAEVAPQQQDFDNLSETSVEYTEH